MKKKKLQVVSKVMGGKSIDGHTEGICKLAIVHIACFQSCIKKSFK